MTSEEYNYLAPRFDRHDREIAAIPQNINRAGKLYRKLLKQIYESKHTN
jgi:hypothetical protein